MTIETWSWWGRLWSAVYCDSFLHLTARSVCLQGCIRRATVNRSWLDHVCVFIKLERTLAGAKVVLSQKRILIHAIASSLTYLFRCSSLIWRIDLQKWRIVCDDRSKSGWTFEVIEDWGILFGSTVGIFMTSLGQKQGPSGPFLRDKNTKSGNSYDGLNESRLISHQWCWLGTILTTTDMTLKFTTIT